MSYFPVMLDLTKGSVGVVGGGAAAARRVESLLAAGAQVAVFAVVVGPKLSEFVGRQGVRHFAREPTTSDFRGIALVLAERRDANSNAALSAIARSAGALLSIEDEPALSSFIMPAVVRRGDLVVSISTSGSAPALAVRFRQSFEARIGVEHARFLNLARRFRGPLQACVSSFEERRKRWYELVDSDVFECLRNDEEGVAERRAVEIMGVSPDD